MTIYITVTEEAWDKLQAVYDAAGEYLYDTSKRQGLMDAYIAVKQEKEDT